MTTTLLLFRAFRSYCLHNTVVQADDVFVLIAAAAAALAKAPTRMSACKWKGARVMMILLLM